MRKKTVTINEKPYTVAALNMEQVERLMADEKEGKDFIGRSWSNIVDSMMNAGGTPDLTAMKRELDFDGFLKLNAEVLKLSSLTGSKTGEIQAAMAQ